MEIGWNGHLAAAGVKWASGSKGSYRDYAFVCINCNSRFMTEPCSCGGSLYHTAHVHEGSIPALVCDRCGKGTREWVCPHCLTLNVVGKCLVELWMT